MHYTIYGGIYTIYSDAIYDVADRTKKHSELLIIAQHNSIMQCIPAMLIMVITLIFSTTKQTNQSVYKYMIYKDILISTV